MAAFTWPESTFELDSGIGLAVCVQHKGAHPWYAGACVAFAAQRQPKRLRVALTRQDRPEPPAEPPRVEVDVNGLAAGIALALDALMQRRREERTSQSRPAVPAAANGSSDILDRYET